MLFVLNIDGLIINYISLNDLINKWVIHVVLRYLITNWVVFEFVNFDVIIIRIVFELTNTVDNIYILTRHELLPLDSYSKISFY